MVCALKVGIATSVHIIATIIYYNMYAYLFQVYLI